METENNQTGNIERKYGYIRISSKEQNLARQLEEMKKLNLTYIFEEKISGKNLERPELQKMISILVKGDAVVVMSLDRLARNTKDLLSLIEIFNKKGIHFISLKENIDTMTSTGIFMLTVLGAMAELERSYIRECQQQGIDIAKRLGKYKGRKEKELPQLVEMAQRVQNGELKVEEVCRLIGISRATYYRRINKLGLGNEIIDF